MNNTWKSRYLETDFFTRYRSCRHLEIEFTAISMLIDLATTEKWSDLLAESPELLQFCIENYRDARSQSNRRTNNLRTGYNGNEFLYLLSVLCAASETVCCEFLLVGGLDDLRAALRLDPNGTDSEGNRLYFEVRTASEFLLQILLAENGRHVQTVLTNPEISKGVPPVDF